jgi:hypothetical protein
VREYRVLEAVAGFMRMTDEATDDSQAFVSGGVFRAIVG